MNKIIYLASGNSFLENYNITYQDINGKRDIDGDMMEVNLNEYDILIATPPCNYYSRCNYRRETSEYSLTTKHLLPSIIEKFISTKKPFIVENVRNSKLFNKLGLYKYHCYIIEVGRHTYWTNVDLGYLKTIPQRQDFKNGGYVIKYDDMKTKYHQGGYNVEQVLKRFLKNCLTE